MENCQRDLPHLRLQYWNNLFSINSGKFVTLFDSTWTPENVLSKSYDQMPALSMDYSILAMAETWTSIAQGDYYEVRMNFL